MRFTFGGSGADFGASGFSDFFETLFGGGGRGFSGGNTFGGASFGYFTHQPRKGRDVEARLVLTLEEAYLGGKKNLTLSGAPGNAPRSLAVAIPAGIKNGARIRLAGQGDPSPMGGAAGDMFLKVSIQTHTHFTLDDADVMICIFRPGTSHSA